ncbi:hypothetical protein [Kitasatospora sp. NPDC008115]|uniref:hypothetical protein n=1 Tax=Kitasatospora sp. NPDC008115 TaxID=3364022 RepID=UPI0036E78FFD
MPGQATGSNGTTSRPTAYAFRGALIGERRVQRALHLFGGLRTQRVPGLLGQPPRPVEQRPHQLPTPFTQSAQSVAGELVLGGPQLLSEVEEVGDEVPVVAG